mgnify:CR=1 FL=1
MRCFPFICALFCSSLSVKIYNVAGGIIAEDTFYSKPKALFYSGQKAADLGIDNKNFITVVDAQKELSAGINQSIQAILQLLNLVERLLILSPQELGQPAPREISATEVAEITNSTNAIYSFISEGIDGMRSAMKKVVYEHLVSCSNDDFIVPIKGRYSDSVIKEAGFESEIDMGLEPSKRNVIGKTPFNSESELVKCKSTLILDFISFHPNPSTFSGKVKSLVIDVEKNISNSSSQKLIRQKSCSLCRGICILR